jgi:hypothetical protein
MRQFSSIQLVSGNNSLLVAGRYDTFSLSEHFDSRIAFDLRQITV